jgi:hypothetical protein
MQTQEASRGHFGLRGVFCNGSMLGTWKRPGPVQRVNSDTVTILAVPHHVKDDYY